MALRFGSSISLLLLIVGCLRSPSQERAAARSGERERSEGEGEGEADPSEGEGEGEGDGEGEGEQSPPDVDVADAACSDVTGAPFCTVQAALDANLAVVHVAAGTYHEDVRVARDVRVAGSGTGATTLSGITADFPALEVAAGATLELAHIAVEQTVPGASNTAVRVLGEAELVDVVARGGTATADDADTVVVVGDALIEDSTITGGRATDGDDEDNASALRVEDGASVIVRGSRVGGAHAAGGVSYGIVSWGDVAVSRSMIAGGTSTGLFSIGVRNKGSATLAVSSSVFDGGVGALAYALWTSGDAIIIGTNLFGGDSLATTETCSASAPCASSANACRVAEGVCHAGRTHAAQIDRGTLLVVDSVLDGGDGSATGASCADAAALGCVCLDGACEQPLGSFSLSDVPEDEAVSVTLAGVVVVGGLISRSADGALMEYSLISPSEIADMQAALDACGIAGCAMTTDVAVVSAGAPLLASDRAHAVGAVVRGAGVDPAVFIDADTLLEVRARVDVDGDVRPGVDGVFDIGADER